MQKIISGIKKNNPDLKEAEIRGILYLLLERESLDNNELIRLTGIPKPIIKTFKSSSILTSCTTQKSPF